MQYLIDASVYVFRAYYSMPDDDDINPTSKWVVHLGDDEYKLTNDITVLPLANMMKYIINKLA